MTLKCCRIIKTFKLSFFVCEMNCLFFGQCQNCVTWEHGTSPCWAKAHPRISKSFPIFSLCWWEEKIWWISSVGSRALAAGVHYRGAGSCSCKTFSGLSLQDWGRGSSRQGCVLHPVTLLSDWLAAVMLILNQNLLMSCKYWSHLPLRKTQVPSYMFMGNSKITIWSSFGLRFPNCSLVISLLSRGVLINWLYTL